MSSKFFEYIRVQIRRTSDRDPKRKPLRDLKIRARTKTGNVPGSLTGQQKTYLNALVLDMGKHGFIQNHGVNTIREGHKVRQLQPRMTEFERRHHNMKLQQHEFIDRALQKSGVIEYLHREIGRIRGYEVLKDMIHRMVDQVNQAQRKGKRPTSSGYRDKNLEW
ncbi:MAG: hypothetical protein Q4G27_10160 [Flavobacteriaceae bacterium]|nr:hypothetical protein [Flavobacteriaceae bacterium]